MSVMGADSFPGEVEALLALADGRARERDCFARNQDDDGVDRSQAGPGNRIPGHNNG